ncbi:MAG: hypothetical protein ACJ8GJ_12365 [Vitreoscilla sp.]
MANDYLCWAFTMPSDDLQRFFSGSSSRFYQGSPDDDIAQRMGEESVISSRADWLHWSLRQMRASTGDQGLDPLLADASSALASDNEDAGEGFLVSVIAPHEISAVTATARSWLDLAAEQPQVVASALDEDDFSIVEELQTAMRFTEEAPYDLEGDRPAQLFSFLRHLLAQLERASEEGSSLVQVRYVYL